MGRSEGYCLLCFDNLRLIRAICSVPDDAYYACEDANTLADSPTYHNESAFYDCLDQHAVGGQNPGGQISQDDPAPEPIPLTLTQIENGCDKPDNVVSEDTDREALITITNTGGSTLNIYWIDFSGMEVELDSLPYPQNVIEAGAVNEFSTNRGYLFAVLDDNGTCAGVLKPRESRNSY
jgi:hypothetical protein